MYLGTFTWRLWIEDMGLTNFLKGILMNQNRCCDLHTHTIASDGSDTPGELVKKAAFAQLASVAVTDHDTVDGIPEAMDAAKDLPVEVIPGIELSVVAPKGNMHVLGYYIDTGNSELLKVIKMVQNARAERNPKILSKLKGLGLHITEAELLDMAKGGQIGRPHIARALVNRGYVKSVSEAFEKYLKKGAAAYVPKSILSPQRAFDAIHKAQGVAVLAHPISLKFASPAELDGLVSQWIEEGLDGIECYYSEHSDEVTRLCLALVAKYDLVATGGSDYHGKAKPYIKLGVGKGSLCVPEKCVEELKRRKAQLFG